MIAQSRVSHSRIDPARPPLAATILPIIVMALAGCAVRTPLAAAYPLAALLLFTWIAADTLTLALIARTPRRRPPARAVLGALAGASVVVALGTPAPLRAILIETPLLAASMIALIVAHVGWATGRARRALHRTTGSAADRWKRALAEIFPPALVRLAAAELAILHIALFRWGEPADVPANARAFAYHKHLTPMCAALLILSGIEIAVYHLLVGHWSRTAAIVMFVLSDLGFVYLIGLVKSFRFRPILLTPDGVQVRSGLLIDQAVPLDAIASIETGFTGEDIRDPATLNAALLAWPNVLLRLNRPIARTTLWRTRRYTAVAFRLDDPAPFVRLLTWRAGQSAD